MAGLKGTKAFKHLKPQEQKDFNDIQKTLQNFKNNLGGFIANGVKPPIKVGSNTKPPSPGTAPNFQPPPAQPDNSIKILSIEKVPSKKYLGLSDFKVKTAVCTGNQCQTQTITIDGLADTPEKLEDAIKRRLGKLDKQYFDYQCIDKKRTSAPKSSPKLMKTRTTNPLMTPFRNSLN